MTNTEKYLTTQKYLQLYYTTLYLTKNMQKQNKVTQNSTQPQQNPSNTTPTTLQQSSNQSSQQKKQVINNDVQPQPKLQQNVNINDTNSNTNNGTTMQVTIQIGHGDEGDQGNQDNQQDQWESEHSGVDDEDQQEMEIQGQFDHQIQSDEIELQDDYNYQVTQQKKTKIQIRKLNLSTLSPIFKTIFQNLSKNIPLSSYIKIPPSKTIKKEVCAKLITFNDTVIQCFDCRMDPTCIICHECFKNGNHEGHRYVLKKFAGGCCDCGDPEAWSQKGFCKNHSGEFKDFQVQKHVLQQFSQVMDALFYLYFYLMITDDKNSRPFNQRLLIYLNQLNQNNTYYNKLTSYSLAKRLPAEYSLNQQLDNRTVLQNILSNRISGPYFRKWFDLFIKMFPYYPLKLEILKHYVQNYGDIVDGGIGSVNNALSISCQILTSYKVVEEYSMRYNVGLGQGSQLPTNTEQLQQYCKMFMQDISCLTKLSEKASFHYWKMHINSKQSIRNLFHYYRVLLKKVKQYQKNNARSQNQILAEFINFSQMEQLLLQNFARIIGIVSQQPKLIQKIIYVLWKQLQKINKEYNPESLCIFRPIQRCLILSIFKYFQNSLQNIQNKKQKLLKEVLKINDTNFQIDCQMTLKKLFKTLLFYSKTQSSPGLAQTCYVYLYFYKIQQRLFSMIDIVGLKMFLLMMKSPYPLTFQSIIQIDNKKLKNQNCQKQYQIYFSNCLTMSKIIFTSVAPEIYLTYSIIPQLAQQHQYKKQIKQIIVNFFKQKQKAGKYQVPQNDIKTQLLEGIFPAQCKIADLWVKNNCTLNKGKKIFVLDAKVMEQEMQVTKITGLNFDDFMISLSSKDPYADIRKSLNFIKGYNLDLFNLLWNQVSLQSLKHTLHTLYSHQNKQTAEGYNYTTILPSILTVYILTKQSANPSAKNLTILTQILKQYIASIPKSIMAELGVQLDSMQIQKFQKQYQKQKQEQANVQLLKKKQKISQIKQKKLQNMKKKQQEFLERKLNSMEEQPIPRNINENQQILDKCCIICKNELNQDSVYILNLSIRNHQKLLKIGSGLQCISINSCKHMCDYKCIEKMYKKNNYIDSISCPLCKFQGNVIFPASSNFSNKLAEQIHDRVIQLLFMMRQNAHFYEEIVKSFYHYVLLCGVDFERTVNRKGQLYRTLLIILKKYIQQNEIKQLKQKLLNKKISKKFQKHLKQQTNKPTQSSGFTHIFFNLLTNHNMQQAIQFHTQLNLKKEQSIVQPKSTPETDNKQKQHEQEEYSELFYVTVSEILEYLVSKGQLQGQKMDNQEFMTPVRVFVKDCLRNITQADNKNIYERSLPYSICNQQNLHLFNNIPHKYVQISNKKCHECSQISQQAIMCLQCNWIGCQKCDKSYAKTHINSAHGQVGAIMVIQKASAYYITSQKSVYTGQLYEDQWENNIMKSQDWSNFELNTNLLRQMQRNILVDEIPTRHAKKNK